jgi:hypothetical protein
MAVGCKDAIALCPGDTARKYREAAKPAFDRIKQAGTHTDGFQKRNPNEYPFKKVSWQFRERRFVPPVFFLRKTTGEAT